MSGIWQVGKRYARRAIKAPGQVLGATLLRNGTLRQYMNQAYEELGPGFADAFIRLFEQAPIRNSFDWQNTFAEKQFSLPVFPELPRSWNNALVWRWAGNRAIRKFYEFYLQVCPQGIFFDIGANDGTHTYPFAASRYECVCFEPQPSCVSYIRRTCELNGFQQVRIEPLAVSNREAAQVEFFISDSSWYSSLVRENVEQLEAAKPLQVRTVTLDTFCRETGLSPNLVKIDVEGCEWQVIEGGKSTLTHVRPNFLVEIQADPVNVAHFWQFFRALQYNVYFVSHYTTAPFRRMSSLDDCLAAISDDTRGDFIALARPQVIRAFEHTFQCL